MQKLFIFVFAILFAASFANAANDEGEGEKKGDVEQEIREIMEKDDPVAKEAKINKFKVESAKFWEVLKVRDYDAAEAMLKELGKSPDIAKIEEIAEIYKHDEIAMKQLRAFWALVEEKVKVGSMLLGGTVQEKSGGKLKIAKGNGTETRKIIDLTARQAEAIAGIKNDPEQKMMLAMFVLAEDRDVAAKRAALEAAGPRAEFYKSRLPKPVEAAKEEPKPQEKEKEAVLTCEDVALKSATDLLNEKIIKKIPKDLLPAEGKGWDDFAFAKVDQHFNNSLNGEWVRFACKITGIKWDFDGKDKKYKVTFNIQPEPTMVEMYGCKFIFSSWPATATLMTDEAGARQWNEYKDNPGVLPRCVVLAKIQFAFRNKKTWNMAIQEATLLSPQGGAYKPPDKK